MLCLGWCAHADPAANVTAAGGRVDVSSHPLALAQAEPPFTTCREHAFFAQGFATQVFSSEAEAQLSAHPPPEGIDRALFTFGLAPVGQCVDDVYRVRRWDSNSRGPLLLSHPRDFESHR